MAYNYAKEKRKFDAEWKRKASWYRKEGMSVVLLPMLLMTASSPARATGEVPQPAAKSWRRPHLPRKPRSIEGGAAAMSPMVWMPREASLRSVARPSLHVPAHRYRQVSYGRVVETLDGGIAGVHVNVHHRAHELTSSRDSNCIVTLSYRRDVYRAGADDLPRLGHWRTISFVVG